MRWQPAERDVRIDLRLAPIGIGLFAPIEKFACPIVVLLGEPLLEFLVVVAFCAGGRLAVEHLAAALDGLPFIEGRRPLQPRRHLGYFGLRTMPAPDDRRDGSVEVLGRRIERVERIDVQIGRLLGERPFHLAANGQVLHVMDQRVDRFVRHPGERRHRRVGYAASNGSRQIVVCRARRERSRLVLEGPTSIVARVGIVPSRLATGPVAADTVAPGTLLAIEPALGVLLVARDGPGCDLDFRQLEHLLDRRRNVRRQRRLVRRTE